MEGVVDVVVEMTGGATAAARELGDGRRLLPGVGEVAGEAEIAQVRVGRGVAECGEALVAVGSRNLDALPVP